MFVVISILLLILDWFIATTLNVSFVVLIRYSRALICLREYVSRWNKEKVTEFDLVLYFLCHQYHNIYN